MSFSDVYSAPSLFYSLVYQRNKKSPLFLQRNLNLQTFKKGCNANKRQKLTFKAENITRPGKLIASLATLNLSNRRIESLYLDQLVEQTCKKCETSIEITLNIDTILKKDSEYGNDDSQRSNDYLSVCSEPMKVLVVAFVYAKKGKQRECHTLIESILRGSHSKYTEGIVFTIFELIQFNRKFIPTNQSKDTDVRLNKAQMRPHHDLHTTCRSSVTEDKYSLLQASFIPLLIKSSLCHSSQSIVLSSSYLSYPYYHRHYSTISYQNDIESVVKDDDDHQRMIVQMSYDSMGSDLSSIVSNIQDADNANIYHKSATNSHVLHDFSQSNRSSVLFSPSNKNSQHHIDSTGYKMNDESQNMKSSSSQYHHQRLLFYHYLYPSSLTSPSSSSSSASLFKQQNVRSSNTHPPIQITTTAPLDINNITDSSTSTSTKLRPARKKLRRDDVDISMCGINTTTITTQYDPLNSKNEDDVDIYKSNHHTTSCFNNSNINSNNTQSNNGNDSQYNHQTELKQYLICPWCEACKVCINDTNNTIKVTKMTMSQNTKTTSEGISSTIPVKTNISDTNVTKRSSILHHAIKLNNDLSDYNTSTKLNIFQLYTHLSTYHTHFTYHLYVDEYMNIHIMIQRDISQNLNDTAICQEKIKPYSFYRPHIETKNSSKSTGTKRLIHDIITMKLPRLSHDYLQYQQDYCHYLQQLSKYTSINGGTSLGRHTSHNIEKECIMDETLYPLDTVRYPFPPPAADASYYEKQLYNKKKNHAFSSRHYYHVRYGVPITDYEFLYYDSDKDITMTHEYDVNYHNIDEYEDISIEEKEFMKIWNSHIYHCPPYANAYIPYICELFIRKYRHVISEKQLRHNCLLHFLNLLDFNLLTHHHITTLMDALDKGGTVYLHTAEV